MGGTPEMPTVPERQAAKLPDGGSATNTDTQAAARRRALMATVLTSNNGAIGMPSVSGAGTKAALG
ncbi:hypothetical protein [Sphingomonas sp.]|uniref:hypothetical protein n=1 Tax=Sphingomonas sp. TaxID=28214 RepID=UPI0035C814F7